MQRKPKINYPQTMQQFATQNRRRSSATRQAVAFCDSLVLIAERRTSQPEVVDETEMSDRGSAASSRPVRRLTCHLYLLPHDHWLRASAKF